LNNAHNATSRDLVTHRFAMTDILKGYDTFGNAAKESALKMVLNNDGAEASDNVSSVAG
jgi:alcohol dehydrogenase